MKSTLQRSTRTLLQYTPPWKRACLILMAATVGTTLPISASLATPFSSWTTVVNNGDKLPEGSSTKEKWFFSYNQPSINDEGVVVFRARAKGIKGGEEGSTVENASESTGVSIEVKKEGSGGGGEEGGGTIEGIFTRDMLVADSPILAVAVRGQNVPPPYGPDGENVEGSGLGSYNGFPSFPRIDASSDTLAFRGQSTPSYVASVDGKDVKSGTSGLYAILDNTDDLITGIRNIEPNGGVANYFVPGEGVRFEQFPGAPSPTGSIITFKGNWTDTDNKGQTGVYYRDMLADGNVVKIAERGDFIPEAALPLGMLSATFDSTSPPSAAAGKMVFTGLDFEANPTAGGIFMAELKEGAALKTVAGFQTEVPSNYLPSPGSISSPVNNPSTLNSFGEGLSFDGRYVGFWAGWGDEKSERQLKCKSDGKDKGCAEETVNVSKNQGIFLADTETESLFLVAQTGPTFEGQTDYFEDFLFWNFSGNSSGEEGIESARWRSSAFLAVDGNDIVFKGLKANGEVGLYGALNVDVTDKFDYDNLFTILTIGMDGGVLDGMAKGLPIVSLGIERDGFRNGKLAIAASMTDGDNSWAGIYTSVPEPGSLALFAVGLSGLAIWRRKR